MSTEVPPDRRVLTRADMERMRVPVRYWEATLDRVSAVCPAGVAVSPQALVANYLAHLPRKAAAGVGLLLYGPNGTGKTSVAAVIAKEWRRSARPVLWLAAAEMKAAAFDHVAFDEDEGLWERAFRVSLLVLDDLGKGTGDSTGAGDRLLDELIRHRNGARLTTIITTNLTLTALAEALKPSTLHTLKEHVYPVEVRGVDQREGVKVAIATAIRNDVLGGSDGW